MHGGSSEEISLGGVYIYIPDRKMSAQWCIVVGYEKTQYRSASTAPFLNSKSELKYVWYLFACCPSGITHFKLNVSGHFTYIVALFIYIHVQCIGLGPATWTSSWVKLIIYIVMIHIKVHNLTVSSTFYGHNFLTFWSFLPCLVYHLNLVLPSNSKHNIWVFLSLTSWTEAFINMPI